MLRVVPSHQYHGQHHQDCRQNAWQNASGKQLANVGFGDDPVDDQNGGGRDHDAQRAAGRDHAGRHGVAVAHFLHGRVGYLAHGRGCRDGRTANGAKTRACSDGGVRQAAFAVANEGVGRMKELVGQASAGDKVAHQNEQRNDRQGVGKAGFVHHLGSTGHGGHPAAGQANAHNAHQAHGKSQGHAKQGQYKDGQKSKQGFGHRVPPSDDSSADRAGQKAFAKCTRPVRPHSTPMP